MKEKLEELLARFADAGLVIDVEKSMASLTLSGDLNLASSKNQTDTSSGEPLELEENDKFLFAPFRALSAAFIESRGIDFSKEGVLKKSYKLMKGQTVYPNHDRDVTKWLGHVSKSWFDDESGKTPGGVNATLALDKKWNEKIVDGVKNGAIHSVSVSVVFEWEKSHPDLGSDFYWHLGETINNHVVRMIVTKIINYGEISLVWQGACVSSKRLFNIPKDSQKGKGSEKNLEENNNTEEKDFMLLTRKQAIKLGLSLNDYGFGASSEIELDALMQEKFLKDTEAKLKKVEEGKVKLSQILEESFGIEIDSEDLEKQVSDTKLKIAAGDKFYEELKTDTLKFAKLSEGKEELSPTMEKLITGANATELSSLRDEFKSKADKEYPLTCNSCGGTLSRASAKKDKSDLGEEKNVEISESDFEI